LGKIGEVGLVDDALAVGVDAYAVALERNEECVPLAERKPIEGTPDSPRQIPSTFRPEYVAKRPRLAVMVLVAAYSASLL